MDDLVEIEGDFKTYPKYPWCWIISCPKFYRDNTYYKKFSNTPFSGEIHGKERGKFKDGKRVGTWEYYDDDGIFLGFDTYKMGIQHGPSKGYKNGKLSSEANWKWGFPDGLQVWYNYDGTVEEEVCYENKKRVNLDNCR